MRVPPDASPSPGVQTWQVIPQGQGNLSKHAPLCTAPSCSSGPVHSPPTGHSKSHDMSLDQVLQTGHRLIEGGESSHGKGEESGPPLLPNTKRVLSKISIDLGSKPCVIRPTRTPHFGKLYSMEPFIPSLVATQTPAFPTRATLGGQGPPLSYPHSLLPSGEREP